MKITPEYGGFGTVIAFLVPGFVVFWGASYHCAVIKDWIVIGETNPPSVGGFLFATLGSVAAGVTVSAIRWLLCDRVICKVFRAKVYKLDFAKLPGKEEAYSFVNENHYKFYQYYANMLVALLIAYFLRLFWALNEPERCWNLRESILLLAIVATEIVLAIGAIDCRKNFYTRAESILSNGKDEP